MSKSWLDEHDRPALSVGPVERHWSKDQERVNGGVFKPGPGKPPVASFNWRIVMRRLRGIHLMIARGNYPSAKQMAEELEVSVKTIRRDLDLLRDVLGMPVEYYWVEGGWHYREPVVMCQVCGSSMRNADCGLRNGEGRGE